MPVREGIYGLLAEFDTPTELVVAAQASYDAGYRRMDCYTPYPVEEAAEAMGFDEPKEKGVSRVCLLGGILGGLAMFTLESWISIWAYPLDIAGSRQVFLGGLHHSGIRVDDFVGRAFRWFRHAGAESFAGALSPCIQRAEFSQWRNIRQVLSLPGGR